MLKRKLFSRKAVENRTQVLVVLLVAVLANLAAKTSAAKEDTPYEWSDVSRIVAIGDIHGAYDAFASLLVNAGLVNDRLNWVGDTTHLVQTGDIVDRGPDSKKVMDLLMKLEKQAKRAGGQVHVLIGNHEAMNLVGILNDVSAQEFVSYTDSESPSRREKVFEFYYEEQKEKAKAEGEVAPSKVEVRTSFESKYPLGYVEHRLAFGPKGRYGRWIRKQNAAIRINGIVFSHGDWSEDLSALGIQKFNQLVRNELSGKAPLTDGVTFRPESPLQYRGLSKVPLVRAEQEASRASVVRILSHLQATRMVVGHTVTQGFIESRFGGTHISIDAGMLDLYRGGHQVALEIEGNNLRAIHPLGKVSIPNDLDETTLFDYLVEVAAVDPENLDVLGQLAQHHRSRGDLETARDTLEQLFRIPKPIPLDHHRELGVVYEELGNKEKARELYLAYIAGLKRVIDAKPDNVGLVNILARFCLTHHLELHWAEEIVRHALVKHTASQALEVTLELLSAASHAATGASNP